MSVGSNQRSARADEQAESVVHDGRGVTRFLASGETEFLAWDDLVGVYIMTNDEGPFMEDFYIVLRRSDDGGCLLPQCLVDDALLSRLFALPGFDYEAFIEASSSVENAVFTCWQRTA